MTEEQVTEGRVPFDITYVDEKCETYYKVFGDIRSGQYGPPVVVIHGGPGSGHNYLLAFRKLWYLHKLPVIFYDQIGCGQSTHLRHTKNNKTFWTMDLMVHQLETLITRLHLAEGTGYSVLGHSFGGMIGSYFAVRRPQGLKRLVLANAPASVDLHVYGNELCWKKLPAETQRASEEAIRSRDWNAQSYLDGLALLRKTNWCRADPFPEELKQSEKNHSDDQTVFESMWGATLLEPVGSLKGWHCFSRLPQINVPTLLYHGEWDIDRDEVIAPYLERIPRIRTVTVEGASHMSHLDSADCQERVIEMVGSFFLEE